MERICSWKPVVQLSVFLTLVLMLSGCGGRKPDVPDMQTVAEMRAEKKAEKETVESGTSSAGGENGSSYLEKMTIGDINDPDVACEFYMPKGSEISEGYGFYHQHGLYISAFGNRIKGYDDFAYYFGLMLEYLPGPALDYEDIYCSGLLENGEDRYFIYTGRCVQYDGTPLEIRILEYMMVQPTGDCVNLSLQFISEEADVETDPIIEAIEDCYGITLEQFHQDSILQEGAEYAFQEGENKLEALKGYDYLGKTILKDYNGRGSCPVMIPEGDCRNIGDFHAYSYGHGVWTTADVEEFYSADTPQAELKSNIEIKRELCLSDPERIFNIQMSKILPLPGFEDACYATISYQKKGYDGTYTPKVEILCYIQYDKMRYLALDIFLSGERYDAETAAVIRELEQAYGMDLSAFYQFT